MTLDDLNQHLALKSDLAKVREMADSLRAAACPGAAALPGAPHASGVKDKVGDLAAEIADLDTVIKTLEAEIERSTEKVVNFIQGVDDIQTRLIFRLRFVRGLTWAEVAVVIGGKNSEEAVKSTCYRYFRTCTE